MTEENKRKTEEMEMKMAGNSGGNLKDLRQSVEFWVLPLETAAATVGALARAAYVLPEGYALVDIALESIGLGAPATLLLALQDLGASSGAGVVVEAWELQMGLRIEGPNEAGLKLAGRLLLDFIPGTGPSGRFWPYTCFAAVATVPAMSVRSAAILTAPEDRSGNHQWSMAMLSTDEGHAQQVQRYQGIGGDVALLPRWTLSERASKGRGVFQVCAELHVG